MQLGDFKSLVRAEALRGNSLDALIPDAICAAVRWLELNGSYAHMKVIASGTLTTGSRSFTLPTDLRNIMLFRVWKETTQEGDFQDLFLVHPRDITEIEEGLPNGYYLDGREAVLFDNTPDEDYAYELQYFARSNFPTEDTETHPWLEVGANVLLYQTMIQLAPLARAPEWLQLYQPMREEALRVFSIADDDLTESNQDESMIYA